MLIEHTDTETELTIRIQTTAGGGFTTANPSGEQESVTSLLVETARVPVHVEVHGLASTWLVTGPTEWTPAGPAASVRTSLAYTDGDEFVTHDFKLDPDPPGDPSAANVKPLPIKIKPVIEGPDVPGSHAS